MPTARVIAITPVRSAESRIIRARQTTFCGVFRPDTHSSSADRSADDSQRHAFVLIIAPDSHTPSQMGILRQERYISMRAPMANMLIPILGDRVFPFS